MKALTDEEYIEKYGYEEGTRRIKRREYMKRYNAANKEEKAAYKKAYDAAHKEEKAAYNKKYRAAHREEKAKYDKEYRTVHRDKIREYFKKLYSTQSRRATNLVKNYKQLDKRYNRGDCTITADWIVNNIFNSKCVYCGEEDWKKLGCDRIDNSKPHTPLNVVCCCGKCNREKGLKSIELFKQIKKEVA